MNALPPSPDGDSPAHAALQLRERTVHWIRDYVAAQNRALDTVPAEAIASAVDLIRQAGIDGRRIFICGNGGSAANASHFSTDLGKTASAVVPHPFKVMSLTDNVAWITAIGNDFSFEDVFVRQLSNQAEAGDILILSSVSGSSPNLLAAIRWAREHRLVTVALVGKRRGTIAEYADHLIVIDESHYGRVEDVEMNILHMLCYGIVEIR